MSARVRTESGTVDLYRILNLRLHDDTSDHSLLLGKTYKSMNRIKGQLFVDLQIGLTLTHEAFIRTVGVDESIVWMSMSKQGWLTVQVLDISRATESETD